MWPRRVFDPPHAAAFVYDGLVEVGGVGYVLQEEPVVLPRKILCWTLPIKVAAMIPGAKRVEVLTIPDPRVVWDD